MNAEDDVPVHLRVPREMKGRWVARSRAAGLKLNDWIVERLEAPTADEEAGMFWWNNLTEPARAHWLQKAGPSVADAWAHHKQLASLPETGVDLASGGESSPTFIRRLLVLAGAAYEGDQSAQAELRRSGDLLDFAGGAAALAKVQGLAHDYQIDHPELSKGRDLAGMIGSCWEHIESWAKL